jgi:hypothetical protein
MDIDIIHVYAKLNIMICRYIGNHRYIVINKLDIDTRIISMVISGT